MSVDKLFDERSMARELATAVDEEERRVKENDMKIRAVSTAGSYEEWKNLVACAHLKPIGKDESVGAIYRAKNGRGSLNRSGKSSSRRSKKTPTGTLSASSSKAPRNFFELCRDWRRVKGSEKRFKLLSNVKGDKDAFAADAEMLGEILVVMRDVVCSAAPGSSSKSHADAGTAGKAVVAPPSLPETKTETPPEVSPTSEVPTSTAASKSGSTEATEASKPKKSDEEVAHYVMCALATSSRFSLELQMLSRKEQDAGTSILDALANSVKSGSAVSFTADDLEKLRKLYNPKA